jgi:hypothetical protein
MRTERWRKDNEKNCKTCDCIFPSELGRRLKFGELKVADYLNCGSLHTG